MSNDDRIDFSWSNTDTERFFATIGKYVIIFQYIEGIIDQVLLMGWESSWRERHAAIAKLTNEKKINDFKDLVANSEKFSRARSRPEWIVYFEQIIVRLHGERMRRNKILHSQYIFEFVDKEIAPPLRSYIQKRTDGDMLDQDFFSKKYQEDLLKEISKLAIDVGFVRVQLIADYGAPAS